MDAEDGTGDVGQLARTRQTTPRLAGDGLELRNCRVCQSV